MLFLDRKVNSYKLTKSALMDMHSELMDKVHKKDVTSCARKLGLFKKKSIYFPNEMCADILMDFAMYAWPQKDRAIVQTVRNINGKKKILLDGMRKNVFSLFRIDILGNYRLKCTDIFRDLHYEEVIDVYLSRTVPSGFIFASRLLQFDDYYCFTGAGFPILDEYLLEDIISNAALLLEKYGVTDVVHLNKKQETLLEAIIIKQCIRHGAYEHFFTQNI